MGADGYSGTANAFKQWLQAQRQERTVFVDEYPCVNLRNGVIVGSDGPDLKDGTYVRIDDLPSKGGTVFNAVVGDRLDTIGAGEVKA